MPNLKCAAIACAILLAICGCTSRHETSHNAIYYWRTTLDLTQAERDFLKDHDIDWLYLRYFDVDMDWNADNYAPVPKATIIFNDSLPQGAEIVPVVYITPDAIENMQMREDEYADKILRRVTAMSLRHGIDFEELQLDCDWARLTRDTYYRLCEEVKRRLGDGKRLSSTIRLHQLTQDPPPVDCGVLMVYNTGNLQRMTTDNSIFSRRDIEPYLRDDRLTDYPLPLDIAYPAYGWSLLFEANGDDEPRFKRIMRRTDFSEFPQVEKKKDNLYEVTEAVYFTPESPQDHAYQGDLIRTERPSAREIIAVKRMIDSRLKRRPHGNILYHLDESQLKHYSDNEIDKIYSSH